MIDDIVRKHELMDCMMGQGTHGIIMLNKPVAYCPLIMCNADMLPYDCCYRGDVLFSATDLNNKTETHYKCNRLEE